MSCCARCGQGICSTAGKIALNKVWHKGCFCCYNCNRPLHINSARIYYGEVFCTHCCPEDQEICPLKLCRVNSTPSFNPECPNRMMKPVCCNSSESGCCRPRDVHSCSCIPACCVRQCSPYDCRDCCNHCEESCFKRIHCRPRSPKPMNYPPRQRFVRCPCQKCCPRSPKRRPCPDPCPPVRRKPCKVSPCCEGNKKMIFFQPCPPTTRCPNPCGSPCGSPCGNPCGSPCGNPCNGCGCKYCCVERCKRCGEKVFAAEKVPTSHGAYHLGCFSCYCCCKSLCMKSMYEACGEIYCKRE
ncbi:hypothetical protein Zmor_017493 [Zophobas morio]|uniref:LIM zinc-binding domain-containing protein n=1 Tax=Zophobas morio TaxID=2755281 RepID=A0AA38I8J6_9CUCU|nr:hypothetical protein Zmor_017493 [Zophobas morio]